MQMLNYELAKERIAALKALRNPQQPPGEAWQRASLLETISGWWQSLRARASHKKVAVAYRAELMRQEWLVDLDRAPLKEPKA